MHSPSERVKIKVSTRTEVPGVRGVYFDADERLWCGVKPRHAVSLVYVGRHEFWARGKTLSSAPGAVDLKEPNQVHRDLRRDGPSRFQIISFDSDLVEEAARLQGARGISPLRVHQVDPRDPDQRAFERLHSAFRARRIDALALQAVVAEGVAAFARKLVGAVRSDRRGARAKVGRALEYIHAHFRTSISLDALASAAGLDRFHLCRAFREDVGLPPYAYVIELRMSEARVLLERGHSVADVAADLGFCDQSQLTRHFRRKTGVSPGAYARMVSGLVGDARSSQRSGFVDHRRALPSAPSLR